MGKIYGYCRISRNTQNIQRQINNIREAFPEAIIYEEAYTGTKLEGRKKFQYLLKKVNPGDTIVFDSVSRMSRNAEEGWKTYKTLADQNVNLVFLKEPMINTDTYNVIQDKKIDINVDTGDKAVDTLLGKQIDALNEYIVTLQRRQLYMAFKQAEDEVKHIQQLTKDGLKRAKAEGKRVGGNLRSNGTKIEHYTVKKKDTAKEKIKKHNINFDGTLTNEETWILAGISKNTFYKYKKELEREV